MDGSWMAVSWMAADAGAVARTLVHFVWQGFVVWAAVAMLMLVARPRTAQARYAIYCVTLAVLAACPLVTLVFVAERDVEIGSPGTSAISVTETMGSLVVPSRYARQRVETPGWRLGDAADAFARWLESYRNAILTVWGIGVGCGLLRVAAGSLQIWRIARRGWLLPVELQATVERLGGRMRFRRLPAVRVVEEISQAMAVGIVRPMVLLPAAWVSGLSGEMLEAVIAHELAHLRRWDLLVNVLQRVVEAVLFFHPVVWWCSRRIRVEREMCCDLAAVTALGDRVVYAKALSHLAEHAVVACEPAWALGIGGSKMVLFERIRNVLGLGSTGHGRWYGASCATVGAVAASVVWGAVLMSETTEKSDKLLAVVRDARPYAQNDFGVPVGDPEDRLFTRMPADQVARYREISKNRFPLGIRPDTDTETAQDVPEDSPIAAGNRLLITVKELVSNEALLSEETHVDGMGFLEFQGRKVPVAGMAHQELETILSRTWELPGRNGNVRVSVAIVPDRPAPATIVDAPSEQKKVLLPSYTIEPPDILTIHLAKMEAKKGTTLTQDLSPIAGEYLVAPDGRINLGFHGQVQIAGLTLEDAERKIEGHLAERLESPDVSVEVYAYNSKVYYVIHQGDEKGDVVTRLPVTGNETVLDAISQVNGLSGLSNKHIWIARPQPGGAASDSILQVNWQEITAGAATATNYQVLPGDRIFVAEKAALERVAEGALQFLEKAKATEKPPAARQKAKDWNTNYFIGEER